LIGGGIDSLIPDFGSTYDSSDPVYTLRPLRFDFFANYKPVGVNLFAVRPHIGISFLTIYGATPCFNAGLAGYINILELFSLHLSTGYTEHVWKHAFGLALNFHIVELLAEVSLQSPEFVASFKVNGLGATIGLRLGF
jgi:hypothetical protein